MENINPEKKKITLTKKLLFFVLLLLNKGSNDVDIEFKKK